MWFVLAIAVGIGYLGVGWAGGALGEVRDIYTMVRKSTLC